MTYNLENEYSRKQAEAKFRKLSEKGALIELTEKRTRTLSQNRYLHLLIGVLAMETGNTLEYAKEVYFKRLANAEIFVKVVTDKFAGQVEVLRSSTELTTEQMSKAIDRFKIWASQQGVYLPDPEDIAILKNIEIEMGRCSNFL